MLKILIISFMIFSFSFSNESVNDENFLEPDICEKVYSDCVDICDTKDGENVSECYSQCEIKADNCLQEEEKKRL